MAKRINVVYKIDDRELQELKKQLALNEQQAKKLEERLLGVGTQAKNAGASASSSFLSFQNIIGAISFATVIAGVTQLARKIIDLGIKQEQLNIAFTTFLGSADKAKKVLGDLAQFAIVTPFTPDQVNNAAKTLLAFGVQAEELIPTLKFLGDVSSGTGKDLSEMAVIFGQIRSTGRLMGQDLLQLINAGFNPLQIISEKTGKSVGDLKKEMEKGLITFDMVEKAFIDATSEGGMFFNLMEKQSQSLGGLLSTIEGNLEELGKKIYEQNNGPLRDIVEITAKLTGNTELMAKATQGYFDVIMNQSALGLFLNFLRLLNSETNDAAESQRRYGEALLEQNKALLLTNQTAEERAQTIKNIVTLEQLLGKWKPGTTEDPLPWITDDKNDDGVKQIGIIEDLQNKLKAFNDDLKKATTVEEIGRINNEIDGLQARLKELGRLQPLGEAIDLGNEAIIKEAERLQAELDQVFTYDPEKFAQEHAEKQKEMLDNVFNDRIDTIKSQSQQEIDELREKNEQIIADEEAAAERRKQIQQEIFDFTLGTTQQLLTALLTGREEDFADQEAYFDKQMLLAGDNEKAKAEIQLREDQAREASRKREKERQKEDALIKIGIDTAVNVIRSIANNGGIPLGLPFGALALAAGAAQAVIVRKFRKGEVAIDGPGTTTSDSIPAMLSRGESVIDAEATANSRRLLEAIHNRQIDDRILDSAARAGGAQVNIVDNSDVVQAIRESRVDFVKQGYSLWQVNESRAGFKRMIRAKITNNN